jgi:hypothetical protein
MKKAAYSVYDPNMSGRSLADLYLAIRQDAGLPAMEKGRLINQVKGLTNHANESTPLSSLTYGGLGGILGFLISKYFGMGAVGQTVASLAGFGLGKKLNEQLNKPKNPFPGWKVL